MAGFEAALADDEESPRIKVLLHASTICSVVGPR